MGKVRALVSMPTKPEYKEQFLRALPGMEVTFARFSELNDGQLAGFDLVVGNPEESVLPKLRGMKLLQLNSSGVAAHYLAYGKQHPELVLCSASGAYGQGISEHMLAALLALMKRLHQYRDAMKEGAWQSKGSVRSPRDMRVLVVGAGSIGTEFAKLMQQLGSHTIGLRRGPGGSAEGFDELHTMEKLDSLLPEADVVALALPETPQTVNLMDEKRFSLMKEGSYFLNVGRGSAVVQEALLAALREGRLAGASIDVTTPEPLPPDDPLWQEPNLLLTPHISGYYHLKATHDAVVDIACKNLAAWPEGPFTSRVDYETGYRQR